MALSKHLRCGTKDAHPKASSKVPGLSRDEEDTRQRHSEVLAQEGAQSIRDIALEGDAGRPGRVALDVAGVSTGRKRYPCRTVCEFGHPLSRGVYAWGRRRSRLRYDLSTGIGPSLLHRGSHLFERRHNPPSSTHAVPFVFPSLRALSQG
eukprot:scaffold170_cov281-Pinguiococcus_pyrenoidosus.AAC.7